MDFIADLLASQRIYINFFSFAYMLAATFTFLVGVFLITLKNRSKSTTHLGLIFFYLAPFNAVYIFSHSFYHPIGAFHRWATVGMILLPIIHIAQWNFKYPEIRGLIVSRIIITLQYLSALIFSIYFAVVSLDVGEQFLFTGHHWDFRADDFSAFFGRIIMLYLVFGVGVGVWRAIITKGPQRWTVIFFNLTIFLSFVIPAYLNIASRNGNFTRGTFIFSWAFFSVLGYFVLLIVYLNGTRDRTTFMIKIVGISLVTFLLLMQFLSFGTINQLEEEYDTLRAEYMDRALEGGKYNDDIQYVLKYKPGEEAVQRTYMRGDLEIDFNAYREEMNNTAYIEDIKGLDDVDFRSNLKAYLKNHNDPSFGGYRDAILNFVDESEAEDQELHDDLTHYLEDLNTVARVATNKIRKMGADDLETFKTSIKDYLGDSSGDLKYFGDHILERLAASKANDAQALKREALGYLRPAEVEYTRHYRKRAGEGRDNFLHFTSFIRYDSDTHTVYEVGFSYENYRRYMHPISLKQALILIIMLLILLVIFPLFFKGSLLNPLKNLVDGVREVNDGDLSVQVPIKVQDEIGFLAGSFNKMVVSIKEAQAKLQDYAHTLEEKVEERTRDLNETLEAVNKLKTQQDGDYFLTSLLQKPLNFNANKSSKVSTAIYLEQKKKFDFRNKHADLGGDLCVTGNLRLGTQDDFRRYVVAVNADAMGKSMQGAGGALVLGVVMNSIMARSAKGDRILNKTPEKWLTDVYEELHGVFLAFNGSMVISAVITIIDEESGDMWYFNAEHPFQVLYRNKSASFIEEELLLRKIGLESEIPFKVYYLKLEPGDVVVMGSDGRDDIDTTPDEPVRTINEDEFLFLKRVEESDSDLDAMVKDLKAFGELTDDLSLVRIGFQEKSAGAVGVDSMPISEDRVVIDIDVEDEGPGSAEGKDSNFDDLMEKGREMARQGRHAEALNFLSEAYTLNADSPALNKMMAVLTFKEREYERAIDIIQKYLNDYEDLLDFWLYLSIAHKRMGDMDAALEAAQKVYEQDPERVVNLINLADIYHKRGNKGLAREFIERALQLDPENRQAKSLQATLV